MRYYKKAMIPDELFFKIIAWAEKRKDIAAVCIVGSHARGTARPDSDVDAVILCDRPSALISEVGWREIFGPIDRTEREDWGAVQSLRTFYQNGTEVEFGVASPSWAAIPVDPGTRAVVSDGMKILCDPRGLLEALRTIVAKRAG